MGIDRCTCPLPPSHYPHPFSPGSSCRAPFSRRFSPSRSLPRSMPRTTYRPTSNTSSSSASRPPSYARTTSRRPQRRNGPSKKPSCGRTSSQPGAGRPASPRSRATSTHSSTASRSGATATPSRRSHSRRGPVRMTTNLIRSRRGQEEESPAILQVHGHWKGEARPGRSVALHRAAKLGFVVLCVDAFEPASAALATAWANTTAT